MTLADEIIAYRARHKMSQAEFGEMCGFSRATIVSIENGKKVRRLTEVRIRLLIKDDE